MSGDLEEFKISPSEKAMIEAVRVWDTEGRQKKQPVMFLVRLEERNILFFRVVNSGKVYRDSLDFDAFHKTTR